MFAKAEERTPKSIGASVVKPITLNQQNRAISAQLQTNLNASLIVIKDASRRNELFEEDWLLLKVIGKNSLTLAEISFYSSYGQFIIHIIDLDGDGKSECIFITGNGRGTSVREEALKVFRIEGKHFQEVVSTPFSAFYASGRQWRYSVEYLFVESNRSTCLVMTLTADESLSNLKKNSLIPRVQSKVVKLINPQFRKHTLGHVQTPPLTGTNTLELIVQ